MTEEQNNSISARMRHLLNSPQVDEVPAQTPPPLPTRPQTPKQSASDKSQRSWGERFLRAFWTLASLISMTINLVLLIALLVLWQHVHEITPMASGIGQGLLGGLYDNFVKMDEAHIKTNIAVDTSIPIGFDLPVQTNTTVALTDDVTIYNAYVSITTPLFNINAPATVTLPSGTRLPIALDISVPVQTDVPVHLDVPVDIPLAGTDLHDPFVGLQNVVKPYYCLIMPKAQLWDGRPVCQP